MPDADIGLCRGPFCSTTTSTSSRNTALLRADSLSSPNLLAEYGACSCHTQPSMDQSTSSTMSPVHMVDVHMSSPLSHILLLVVSSLALAHAALSVPLFAIDALPLSGASRWSATKL